MKVYLVTYVDYDEFSVDSAWSTEAGAAARLVVCREQAEKARAWWAKRKFGESAPDDLTSWISVCNGSWDIDTWMLDDPDWQEPAVVAAPVEDANGE